MSFGFTVSSAHSRGVRCRAVQGGGKLGSVVQEVFHEDCFYVFSLPTTVQTEVLSLSI